MAAAIPLPVLSPLLIGQVRYPAAAPGVPPSVDDLAGAIILSQEVYGARSESQGRFRLDSTDVA